MSAFSTKLLRTDDRPRNISALHGLVVDKANKKRNVINKWAETQSPYKQMNQSGYKP